MTECNVPNRTLFSKDNLDVLRSTNSECIDLIYLDPPLSENKKFTAPIGSSAERVEYSDIFREEDAKSEWLTTIKEDQTGTVPLCERYQMGWQSMQLRLSDIHGHTANRMPTHTEKHGKHLPSLGAIPVN